MKRATFTLAIFILTRVMVYGTIPITNCLELQGMASDLSGDYYLANDIDCSCTRDWNGGAGFMSIGRVEEETMFSGTFDGRNNVIINLYQNYSLSYGSVGLFGHVAQEAEVYNVGLCDVNVAVGQGYAGGLVGYNEGSISNSFVSGIVSGCDGGGYIGVLAGINAGTITECYSTGSVVGESSRNFVGGLVGHVASGGIINNSYSTASVSGIQTVGGLVGENEGAISNSFSTGGVFGYLDTGGLVGFSYGTDTNSFWDTQTSRQSSSAGGIGKTTAEMKTKSTFTDAGWDFNNIWDIGDINDTNAINDGYPYLRHLNQCPPCLLLNLINPKTDINVPQNEFFEFTVDVNCNGGDCDDVNVSLIWASEGEWTAKGSDRYWHSVAMSSTGQYQTATVGVGLGFATGYIYLSSDYGATWTAVGSVWYWGGIAMSSTGQYQTALGGHYTQGTGKIYISSDYGLTWTAKDSNRFWEDVAMSSTGQYQTATVATGQIYVSSDYGATWTPKDSNRNWFGIAMSSDGSRQTAVVNGGKIYISTNYGATWTAKDSNRNWYCVAMSSTGQYQTAGLREYHGGNPGQIYISSDYGATWTAKDSNREWFEVTMSSDGKYQTAVVLGEQIYVSSDYGNTWTAVESNNNWHGVAMSSDGSRQTAVVLGGQIYVNTSFLSAICGDVPFYTTDNNPRTITLNQDRSQLVTWHINATGPIGNTYEFYAYANLVSYPNINDTTDKVNVTIVGIDYDGDGIAGSVDNCPYHYNPGQEDSDGDGIGDECEYDSANIDGVSPVDFKDFAVFGNNWLSTDPDLQGDTNIDWIVDISDLAQIAQHWLEEYD